MIAANWVGPRMTAENHAEKKFHDIRKYPNRRYYDTTTSRHLTLEEIQALIRQEHEVRVTDSKAGDDITAAVLTQILLTLTPDRLQVVPVSLLHALIRASEQVVSDFVAKYSDATSSASADPRQRFEHQAREFLGQLVRLSRMAEGVPVVPGARGPMAGSGAAGQGENTCGASELHRAIELLQREVQALKAALSGRRGANPPLSGL